MRLYELLDNRRLIEAGVGKIVQGVNTTADVKPGETKRQAAKFGNKINSKGEPPLLHVTANKNSKSNKMQNLGLIETLTPLQLAILEGGHSLEDF